jgi:hypothetical protein
MAGDPSIMAKKGPEGYIDIVTKWLALDKTLNGLIIRVTIKPHMKNTAKAVLRKNPAILKKVLAIKAAIKGEKVSDKKAKKLKFAIARKAKKLKASKQRRLDVARKATAETNRLRNEAAKLKTALAKKPTATIIKKKIAATVAKAKLTNQVAIAGKKLAKTDEVKEALLSRIKKAVNEKKPVLAKELTILFNKLDQKTTSAAGRMIARLKAQRLLNATT